MKYAVDRIENDVVILQNTFNGKIIEIKKQLLPNNISDGTILEYKDNKYYIDKDEEKRRRNILEEKLNRLKKG